MSKTGKQKRYTLGTLWCYLDSKIQGFGMPKYLAKSKKLKVDMVGGLDKKEVLKYFTGKIDTSEAIQAELTDDDGDEDKNDVSVGKKRKLSGKEISQKSRE